MHSFVRAATVAALLALAAAGSARRADQDFEFDDDAVSPAASRAVECPQLRRIDADAPLSSAPLHATRPCK